MPLGDRDLPSLTYDLAENQPKKCAGLDYIILLHFVVINANLWRSKGIVAACSALFAQPFHVSHSQLAFQVESPSALPLPTFSCEKLKVVVFCEWHLLRLIHGTFLPIWSFKHQNQMWLSSYQEIYVSRMKKTWNSGDNFLADRPYPYFQCQCVSNSQVNKVQLFSL